MLRKWVNFQTVHARISNGESMFSVPHGSWAVSLLIQVHAVSCCLIWLLTSGGYMVICSIPLKKLCHPQTWLPTFIYSVYLAVSSTCWTNTILWWVLPIAYLQFQKGDLKCQLSAVNLCLFIGRNFCIQIY